MKLSLTRIRLLPVTIAAIMALMLVKSALLVQAIAGEAAPSPPPAPSAAPPGMAASGMAAPGSAAPVVSPAPVAPVTRIAPATAAAPDAPPVSTAERAVLLDLRQRREALDARARELDQRAAELAAADRRLDDRVRQLSALQTRLETLEAAREQHQQENWAGLVKVYEAMKPRDAAAIFDALDMQILLQVLDRMQDRKAAPVLAAMQPDRARLATQLLAEMRTRAVTLPAPPPPAQTPPPDPKG